MFMMQVPKTMKVGDTVDCRINQEPARLTWTDAETLTIEPNDARKILSTRIDGEMRVFTCAHAGANKERYRVEKSDEGVVVSDLSQ
jgi:sortase (surface protein transpeptidase)